VIAGLSEGWATVVMLLIFAVLILLGYISELHRALRHERGGRLRRPGEWP
jgi:hypothetical protein